MAPATRAPVKGLLRRFVVRSSATPLVRVYRGIYRAVIALAGAIFRRHRSVVAIYVWRGCATDDFTPGVSDIDLLVVLEDGSDEKAAIQGEFRRMKAFSAGLVDYYPNLVLERSALFHRFRTAAAWRYRYLDGQRSSRLLHGEDVLRALPELALRERRGASYAEMNRWWLSFADRVRARGAGERDVLQDNVVCYKAVSELLALRRAFPSGDVGGPRAAALEGSADPLAARLRGLAAKRFLAEDDRILDDTLAFLLRFYADFRRDFEVSSFLEVLPETQSCDCPRDEMKLFPGTESLLDSLRGHVERAWERRCTGFHVVKSAFWDFDDLLAIVDADPANPPGVRELASLSSLHGRRERETAQRVLLFLRLGDIAFPLTPMLPQDLHRGLLTPATMPDVFLQLGTADVLWTGYARWYLCEWETNDRWTAASEQKREQLRAIARSARSGHVRHPLTEPALRRAAAASHEGSERV